MKLKRYIAVSLFLLTATEMFPCFWLPVNSGGTLLYRIMPLDETDYVNYDTPWECDYRLHHRVDYKADNLRLWQQQTSSDIVISDIEHVVYKTEGSFLNSSRNFLEQTTLKDNTFIRWIVDNKRMDILDFLILAKHSEEVRLSMNDPWYYRVEDGYHYRVLEDIVEQCRMYKSGPLLSRYALQMIRVLCTLRRYGECVDYWYGIKSKLPEDVIKKMCELRVAAALNKTGRQDEALEIYAKHGDVASIRVINGGQIEDELEYVYDRHPSSPYLEEEIQKWLIRFGGENTEDDFEGDYQDTWTAEKMGMLLKVAHRAVKERKSRKMAMWYYTLAALYDIKGEPNTAKRYLEEGMHHPKDPFLKDSYHVLRMWLDAKTATYNHAYERRLMKDLKWLEGKIKNGISKEIYDKIRANHGLSEYLASDSGYDEYYWGYQNRSNIYYWNDAMRRILLRMVCPRMHEAGKYVREIQLANMAENLLVQKNVYSNEMFLIMDRLSYKDTRDYFTRIYRPRDRFDRYLNIRGNTDKHYWYDILATKCLRERRYDKAIVYLKQVPVSFQRQMNVYCYMDKDPFSYDMETFSYDSLMRDDYKLRFAKVMANYDNVMRNHRDPDRRAEAELYYALGLRNSVHRCWFLTRYSSNEENNDIKYMLPYIPYPEDPALYRHDAYLQLSEELIDEAIRTYKDKEQAARQLRRLLHYKLIMDSYGETKTAEDIRRHCDRWRDYARIHDVIRKKANPSS